MNSIPKEQSIHSFQGGLKVLSLLSREECIKRLSSIQKAGIRKVVKQMADLILQTRKTTSGIERYAHIIVERRVHLTIRKAFFSEVFAKNFNNDCLAEIMMVAIRFKEWMPEARFVRTEVGIHHLCNFNVYNATFNGRTIEFKAKENGNVYSMRIF